VGRVTKPVNPMNWALVGQQCGPVLPSIARRPNSQSDPPRMLGAPSNLRQKLKPFKTETRPGATPLVLYNPVN